MTAFSIFEQKMPLCWALLEMSGLRRIITRFDPYLSENIGEGGSFK